MICMFFLARVLGSAAFEEQRNAPSAVAERIAPVGSVRVGDPSAQTAAPVTTAAATPAAAPAAARSGDDVYNTVCAACHVAGVAGAPKMDDKAAWQTRMDAAGGVEGLVASVMNGKGAMPPRGGNASLSDAEVHAAVEHVLKAVGLEAGAASAAAQAATGAAVAAAQAAPASSGAATAAATQAVAAVKEAAGKAGDAVYNTACVACHAAGVAGAPKLGDKAAWEPRAATGLDAMVGSVMNGKGAMPPKGGMANLEDADIRNAVRYMLEQAGLPTGG
ncbi:MAG: cytochrome c5 family protein [Ectothiorhodospiraceae bacterium]|nr:cytochrome c5 family protein [Chromatiales bacterium]MCP5154574.1 cytochrome c5 family protein [Ectothiorhodospiraceae bacterium]